MMNELEDLKTKYASFSVEELLAVIAKLEGEVSHLRLYLFASKKERYLEDPQGMQNMFDEVESALADSLNAVVPEDSESTEDTTRAKKRGKRKRLPQNIRRVRKEIDLAEDQKTCPLHQIRMEKIGESTTEKLEIVPASSYILEEVVFKYKCPCCSEDKLEVVRASKEPDLIPKSFATPSLLAYIATSKYADALPLYRQERIFARYNIDLNRTTMARWMVKAAEACQPLVNLLHDELLEARVVHCDETVVQVLKEPGRIAEQKSYMWCLARQGGKSSYLHTC
jgi:transposase